MIKKVIHKMIENWDSQVAELVEKQVNEKIREEQRKPARVSLNDDIWMEILPLSIIINGKHIRVLEALEKYGGIAFIPIKEMHDLMYPPRKPKARWFRSGNEKQQPIES